jgi:hypothetical protein
MSNFFFPLAKFHPIATQISFELAKECHLAYLKHPTYKLPMPPVAGQMQKYWKGYRIKRNEVMEIFKDQNVTELFVFFGVRPPDLVNSVSDENKKITLIFSPIIVDPDDPTNPNGKIDENGKIYEYVDPCPDKCPTNLK